MVRWGSPPGRFPPSQRHRPALPPPCSLPFQSSTNQPGASRVLETLLLCWEGILLLFARVEPRAALCLSPHGHDLPAGLRGSGTSSEQRGDGVHQQRLSAHRAGAVCRHAWGTGSCWELEKRGREQADPPFAHGRGRRVCSQPQPHRPHAGEGAAGTALCQPLQGGPDTAKRPERGSDPSWSSGSGCQGPGF